MVNIVPEIASVFSKIDWADAAGVAGFGLSMCIAICQLWKNRLKVSLENCVLIDPATSGQFTFFLLCLCNKTAVPFTLTDICIDDASGGPPVPRQKSVFTYKTSGGERKLPVGPVVLSPVFPVRFDSYAAEVLLIQVQSQRINTKYLHPGDSNHSPEGRPCKLRRSICRRYKRQPQPRLILHTSRGRHAVALEIQSLECMDWLEQYAVQKAASQGKIEFP